VLDVILLEIERNHPVIDRGDDLTARHRAAESAPVDVVEVRRLLALPDMEIDAFAEIFDKVVCAPLEAEFRGGGACASCL
jgi:hypothetical protein